MTESFLHYIWQFQYLDRSDLRTTDGDAIQVFHPGHRNPHAGPDFTDARIKIGDLEWRGCVELHIQSSGWMAHQHQYDAAYEPVVLHVVWENDQPVTRSDGSNMPTLELKGRVDELLWKQYRSLITSPEIIPCSYSIQKVQEPIRTSMQERALTERLEKKARAFIEILNRCQNNWEEATYRLLGRNFGFKVNADAFAQLTTAVPLKILLRHADRPLQVEALLFGMAGFLDDIKRPDDYVRELIREFDLLQHKYGLAGKKMHVAQWRFMRLRPANFPTLRMAQFAAFVVATPNLFSAILETENAKDLISLFRVRQSDYWQKHYHFAKKANRVPFLGRSSMQMLVINTAVPVLAAYALEHDAYNYMDRAVAILHKLPAEQHNITRNWSALGWKVQTAFDSQSLLELYQSYCQKRRCLECQVGAALVKPRQ